MTTKQPSDMTTDDFIYFLMRAKSHADNLSYSYYELNQVGRVHIVDTYKELIKRLSNTNK